MVGILFSKQSRVSSFYCSTQVISKRPTSTRLHRRKWKFTQTESKVPGSMPKIPFERFRERKLLSLKATLLRNVEGRCKTWSLRRILSTFKICVSFEWSTRVPLPNASFQHLDVADSSNFQLDSREIKPGMLFCIILNLTYIPYIFFLSYNFHSYACLFQPTLTLRANLESQQMRVTFNNLLPSILPHQTTYLLTECYHR